MTEALRITSRKNDTVKRVASLSTSKGRDAEGCFFTEGIKLYREAVAAGFVPLEAFIADSFSSPDEIVAKTLYSVTDEVYEKMTSQSAPEGLLCVFEKFTLTPERDSCVLLLEEMQDPGNLGTVLRSAAAFGCRQVIGVSSSDVWSPKCVRATMGAVFRMPYKAFDSIDEALSTVQDRKIYAAALTEEARDVAEFDTSRACIMIGNEGHGLSEKALNKSDAQVIIPISDVESLNASTAASVILYDAMRKRGEG